MIVNGTLDNSGNIIHISFSSKDCTPPFFKNDPYMVMFFVLEYPVIENNVSRFRSVAFRAFMVFDPLIAYGILLPAKAACEMTGFTFLRSVWDPESRCRAAIVDKCRAP